VKGKTKYGPIEIDYSRDSLLTEQGMKLLKGYYMRDDEDSPQEAFARAALAYCVDDSGKHDFELAQRIYDYSSKLWFMFASPVLSNAPRGELVGDMWDTEPVKNLPISCFLMVAPDTVDGQKDAISEMASLTVSGGGVGIHNQIRAISDKAPGPIPFEKVIDSCIGYFRQGKVRRGACAYYMDVSHPDIIEHVKFRIPTGGDPKRKASNQKLFHTAVNITEDFVKAVEYDEMFDLVCPHSKEVRDTVRARDLWEIICEARIERGEPFLCFIDVANKDLPQTMKDKGLRVFGSNLCTEIFLPTNALRTAVCCLSSVNLEEFDAWSKTAMIQDLVKFLDNVLSFFIENTGEERLKKANYSAVMERSLGLGAMGFHGYLMKKGIPWESGGFNSAVQENHKIFGYIQREARAASMKIAEELGEAPDMQGTGLRNSHLIALAPNSNSSSICNCTAATEPISSNAFNHRTRVGTHFIENKYLDKLIRDKAEDDEQAEEIWAQIRVNKGSVQNIDFFSDEEKDIFKTAWEIDQHWSVQHAEDRQQYVCQGQSVNLFFPPMSDAGYINSVHLKAMIGRKLKSLYYYRTENNVTPDVVKSIQRREIKDWHDDLAGVACISCEG